MILFSSFQEWFENIEPSLQRRYLLIVVAILVGLSAFFWIIMQTRLSNYDMRIEILNKKRRDVALLVQRNSIIQQQKEHISELVKKDDHYKIIQRFDAILKQNDMIQNRVNESKTTSQEVLDTYIEWTLSIELTALTMKKLVGLLYAIEKEERMYTKHLLIEKTQGSKFVSAHLSIATLEPNTVLAE